MVQALQTIKSLIMSTTKAATSLPKGKEKSPDVSFYYHDFIYPPLIIKVGRT